MQLLQVLNDEHILLYKLFLRPPRCRHQCRLPGLNLCPLVRGGHQLLLRRETVDVELFERRNQQSDALFAVLGLHDRRQFFLHQLHEGVLLSSEAHCCHALIRRHPFLSLSLDGLFVGSKHHVCADEHVMDRLELRGHLPPHHRL